MSLKASDIKLLARDAGFELAGVAQALPNSDFPRYEQWVDEGNAAAMRYLTDRRAQVRADPRNLLTTARSIICVGRLYNGPQPYSTKFTEPERAWISRYAWGDDYHEILKAGLEQLRGAILIHHPEAQTKICVDTVPLLERSYARDAGLGWIGKNTCLINQHAGSWFFLGELITSLDLEPNAATPPDRCGTCTRCIDACPTQALTPYKLDSRRCISYWTIESKERAPAELQSAFTNHIFGCDICQDVCPWNQRAAITLEPAFAPKHYAPPLNKLAAITEPEFQQLFQHSPMSRPRYAGFRRNLEIAISNSGTHT